MRLILVSLAVLTIGGTTGCMSNLQGDVYTREEARTSQQIRFGVVEQVKPVVIEGTKTPIGAAAGAIIGGIAGNSVGGGRGQDIATVVGALGGGLAGAVAEEKFTRSQGVEVTVRLDSGKVMAVVQQASPNESFNIGDRVRVIYGRGKTRVAH